jgi:hypothetical protein
MKKQRKKLLRCAFSLFLALQIGTGALPARAFALEKSSVQSLPDTKIPQNVLDQDLFYIGTKPSEIRENAGVPYRVKIERGGNAAEKAAVQLKIVDITAKYGRDYQLRPEGGGLFGPRVKTPDGTQSVLEIILANQGSVEEHNSTDDMVENLSFPAADRSSSAVGGALSASRVSVGPQSADAATGTAKTKSAAAKPMPGAATPQAMKELYTGESSDRTPMSGSDQLTAKVSDAANGLTAGLDGSTLNLTFPAGVKEQDVDVVPLDNSEGDGERVFEMVLTTPSANMGNSGYGTITLKIEDDEVQEKALVGFGAKSYHAQNGFVELQLHREGALNAMVGATLTTKDGTARAGRDYSAVSTNIIFPYGITTRTVKIPVRAQASGTQAQFTAVLSAPVNCELQDETAITCAVGNEAGLKNFSLNSSLSGVDAQANENSVLVGDKLNLSSIDYSTGVWYHGSSNAEGKTGWKLKPTGTKYDDDRAYANFNAGTHYDYSGYRFNMTLKSKKPCYTDTTIKMYYDGAWHQVWETGTERWGARDVDVFADSDEIQNLYVEQNRHGGFLGKSPELTINSIQPIKRPFRVSLKGADALPFLSANGRSVPNTQLGGGLGKANLTMLDNATNNGFGSAVKFTGDTITVETESRYAYIKGLKIVSNNGRSKIIKDNLSYGTKSVSFKLDNNFLQNNLSYVTFSKNGDHGKLGSFSVQPILNYVDCTVTLNSDYRGSISVTQENAAEASQSGKPADGWYFVRDRATGRYLTYDESGKPSVRSVNGSPRQLWKVESGSKYTYLVSAQDTGKGLCSGVFSGVYMGTAGKSMDNGFQLYRKDGNRYAVRCWFDTYLTAENKEGGALSRKGGGKPEWEFLSAASNGYYRIRNLNSGLYLATENDTPFSGCNVVQRRKAKTESQIWKISRQNDGYYRVVTPNGYSLDVLGASANNQANIQVYSDNGTAAQRFQLSKVSDDGYAVLARCSGMGLDVEGASKADGGNVQQYAYSGGSNQRWILEPASPTETGAEKITLSYHLGDTLSFTTAIQDEYRSMYTTGKIGFSLRHSGTGLNGDTQSGTFDFPAGTQTYTQMLDDVSLTLTPEFTKKGNSVVVRVPKNQVALFDTSSGIFSGTPVRSTGDYNEYTVVPSDRFDVNSWYALTAKIKGEYKTEKEAGNGETNPKIDKVALWQGIHSDTKYSQTTFYYKPSEEVEENVLLLTAADAGNDRYSLTGTAYYTDVSVDGSTQSGAWMPAKGVTVSVGDYRACTEDDGKIFSVPMKGVAGAAVRYKLESGGGVTYQTAFLKDWSDTALTGVGTVHQCPVGAKGLLETTATSSKVAHFESIGAFDPLSNTRLGSVAYINKNPLKLQAAVADRKTYQDGDGVTRTENVTGVEFLVYDSQSKKRKHSLGKAVLQTRDADSSVWVLNTTLDPEKTSSYYASDRIYARITTDRIIGNGKSVDAFRRMVENPALKQTVYPVAFSGITLAYENEKEPVTQDINLPTNANFEKLPMIGSLTATFNIKKVSLSITQLPGNAERVSIGGIPKATVGIANSEHDYDGTADNGVNYGVKDLKKAISDIREIGKNSDSISALANKSWGIYPIFGLYFDFGVREVTLSDYSTVNQFVLMGGGLYLGAMGDFRLTQYFSIGFVPVYFGVSGSLTAFANGGLSVLNSDTFTPDSITKESNTLNSDLIPQLCLQANNSVQAYAGVGLCGTLGIRGGLQADFNYIYNPTIKNRYPDYHENGLEMSLSLRLWADALLLSIPVPTLELAGKRYGYFKDVAKTIEKRSAANSLITKDGQAGTAALEKRGTEAPQWLAPSAQSGILQKRALEAGGLKSGLFAAQTTELLKNGYGHAKPQLADLGNGRTLLVFLNDDKARSSENRTALEYSIYENGKWTAPQVIQNDGTADFEPNLCNAGGSVMISWTGRNTAADFIDAIDYTQQMDVYTVLMNKKTLQLGRIDRLTDDAYCDSEPTGLYDPSTGDRIVYYIKSTAKSTIEDTISPAKNGSVIAYRLWHDGQWRTDYSNTEYANPEDEKLKALNGQRFLSSPISDFQRNDPIIMDFNAVSYNGIGVYSYTVDADNNMDTDSDRELFVQIYNFNIRKTYRPIRITNDNVPDALPQLVRNGDNTDLFWLRNHNELRYLNVTDLVKRGINKDGTIRQDYEMDVGMVFSAGGSENLNPTFSSYKACVDQNGNPYVIWQQPVKNSDGTNAQEIYASALVRPAAPNIPASWSDGVRLTHGGLFNDEATVLVQQNGKLLVADNQYRQDLSTKDGITDVRLVATELEDTGSMETAGVQVNPELPKPGENAQVSVTVKNTGLKSAEGYTLDVYEAKNGEIGRKLYTANSDAVLPASDEEIRQFSWKLPQEIGGLSLVCKCREKGYPRVSAYQSDRIKASPLFEIGGDSVTQENDGFHARFTLTNAGNQDYVQPENPDSADRIVMKSNDLYGRGSGQKTYLNLPAPSLKAGESKEFDCVLNLDGGDLQNGYLNTYLEAEDGRGSQLGNYRTYTIQPTQPVSITVNGNPGLSLISMKKGDSLKLSADYAPQECFRDGRAIYAVKDSAVASVQNDVLTATGIGDTDLVVSIQPYGGRKVIHLTVLSGGSASGK